jgi:hypothetical protein
VDHTLCVSSSSCMEKTGGKRPWVRPFVRQKALGPALSWGKRPYARPFSSSCAS